MFGFKKKQASDIDNKNAQPDMVYQEFWPWLRQFLTEQLPGASVGLAGDMPEALNGLNLPPDREIVVAPEFGLYIWGEFYRRHEQLLQLVWHCRQNDFTDDLTEILVAAGDDAEEQRQGMAEQVMGMVLEPLLAALQNQNGKWESLRLQGKEHRFYACESAVMGRCKNHEAFVANVPQSSLWQRFKSQIMPYLGCKKNYWLKLYQSNFGDEISCELRINDRLVPELTEILAEDAGKYQLTDWDQKQTVLLLQSAETCPVYPFNAAQVRQYALQALRMFAANQESEAVCQKLWTATNDVSLSCDLAHFLPEICCFKCVREADTPDKTFILRCNAWDDDVQLRETQIGCYDWCEQALNEYFSVDKPSQETLLRIIGFGATARAMSAALQNGSKTKNMRFSMVFWVPEDYILR